VTVLERIKPTLHIAAKFSMNELDFGYVAKSEGRPMGKTTHTVIITM
jgi:hypothetical protein